MNQLKKEDIKTLLKQREANSSKKDYGHALIVAGKKCSMGAAVIAARGAIRTGVGLLTVCVPEEEREILQISVPEAMLLLREDQQYDFDHFSAIGAGSGMGINKTTEELLINLLAQFKKPIVLDADALTLVSNRKLHAYIPQETIITPHILEFDRLFGAHQNNDDRMNTAITKAREYQIIIVLKSHQTAIITPDEVFQNSTGNAGLAKGGSGDALTGVITSFLAQGYTPLNAAKLAVYLHGLAADITLNEQCMESMVITDVIENFGKAFESIRS
ncbi:NAD(P)H-hydrate dehydratase [Fluviicola taffensis]|uniref:ADP-dependent (S)-NAD(P)H-hydrate dehydratase n=1 Tax=Fluviicola taffensis (strain DSM 16823 / NCIMB 13979 / RW262) TaxID=755732 RepID=F2I9J5_FLUTR|nr:NAD(P)H-hydrate dehydratase [Fluviicola taffensis]AEA45176.1 YjeF-related protein [Fluviicola taffensis DSM 16823]